MTEEGWDHCCPWASAAGEWGKEERTELSREDSRGEESKRTSVENGERDLSQAASGYADEPPLSAEKREEESGAPEIESETDSTAEIGPALESTDTASVVGAEVESEVVSVEKEAPEITDDAENAGDEVETALGESSQLSEDVLGHADEPQDPGGEGVAPGIESETDSNAEIETDLESIDASSSVVSEIESEVVSEQVEEQAEIAADDEIAGDEVETAFGESSQLSEAVSGHADEPQDPGGEGVAPGIESEAGSTAELEPEPESTDTVSAVGAEVVSGVVLVERGTPESTDDPLGFGKEAMTAAIESEAGSIAGFESEPELTNTPSAVGAEVEISPGESSHVPEAARSHTDESLGFGEEAMTPDIESETGSIVGVESEPDSVYASSTVAAEVVSGVVLVEKEVPESTSEDGISDDAVGTAFGDSPAAALEGGVTADGDSEIVSVAEGESEPVLTDVFPAEQVEIGGGAASMDMEHESESAREEVPELSASEIQATLEAVLYAAGEPLTLREMKKILSDVSPEQVKQGIERLLETYSSEGKGLHIVQVAGGYQVTTRPEYHERVSAMFKAKPPTRLTIQALETLASIAYRQPVTVPEIMELRGVRSASVVRTLLERKLIRIVGRKNVVGRPLLYGTTKDFLVRFGLNDLNELPRLEDMADVFGEEISMPVDDVNGDRIPPASESEEPALPEAVMDGDQEDLDGSTSTPTGEAFGDPEEPDHEKDPVS